MLPIRPIRLLTGALAGAVATAPLPTAGLALHLLTEGATLSPPLVSLGLVPVIGAMAGVWMAEALGRWQDERNQHRVALAQMEDRRRRLADEVAQLHGLELNLLSDLEEAEAELETQGSVLASLADALRTSILSVEDHLRTAEDHRDEARADSVRAATEQLGEVLDLVQDVRAFTRPATQRVEDPPAFNLPEVVAAVLEDAPRRLTGGRAVAWTLSEDVPSWVRGSAERLRTLVEAVTREAARDERGPITLRLEAVGRAPVQGVRLSWADPGPSEDLARGLGSRLCESLGDRLLLGTMDRAVTWWFGSQDAVDPTPLPRARVLVAAEAPDVRARLRRLLERWGLEVRLARTSAEARTLAASEPTDLVLIDLGDESLSALQDLRGHTDTRGLPVLVLTPHLDNLVWLRPPGGEALTRPANQEDLREQVEAVLRQCVPQPCQQAPQRHVLALIPNPTLAATLVRAGAALGCLVTTVASTRAFTEQASATWDVALVDADVDLTEIAEGIALLGEVPGLLISARVEGRDRVRARDAGLSDAAVRPTDAPALARLLSIVATEEPAQAARQATRS